MKEKLLNQRIGSLCLDGEMVEFIPRDMTREGNVYVSEIKGVRFEYTLDFPMENAFYVALRITNVGQEDSPNITGVNSADIRIPKTGKPVLETLSGDSYNKRSFLGQKKPLPNGHCHIAAPTGGRSSNTTAFPYFDITDEENTYVFGIGWSGQWQLHVPVEEDAYTVKVGMLRCDFYLKPGESVMLPSLLGIKGQGLLKTRNAFRELQRRHFSPQAHEKEDLFRPISLCIGSCFKNEKNQEENLLREVEKSAELGFEVAWADAIWFKGGWDRGVGNYSFKDFLPNGLSKVSAYAHEKNMKFLQWFEIERAFPGTEMYTEHGDMTLFCITKAEFNLVDLGNPKTWEFLYEKLSDMIVTQGIDILRIDANIDPLLYWEIHDEPGRSGMKEMHYIQGLYRLWGSLLKRFPHLKMDNCASGGRRLDFELMKYSVSYCRSDYTNGGIFGEMRRYTGIQTMNLNRYLAYTSPIVKNNEVTPYLCRTSFAGAVAFNDTYFNEETWDLAKELIGECKRVRPLWNGDFYPLVEEQSNWSAYQLVRNDKGAIYFLRHQEAENDRLRVNLWDIDPEAMYRVAVTDEKMQRTESVIPGREFGEGYEMVLDRIETSALVEYEKMI